MKKTTNEADTLPDYTAQLEEMKLTLEAYQCYKNELLKMQDFQKNTWVDGVSVMLTDRLVRCEKVMKFLRYDIIIEEGEVGK